jgi:AraC-like DNA-binding protein
VTSAALDPRTGTRPIASVAIICEVAGEHGIDARPCLRAAGIQPEWLSDPEVEIAASQELRLIAELLSRWDEPEGAGLQTGVRYHLTTYGIWSFALLSSRTVRDAHAIAMEFVDLTYAFTRVSAVEVEDELRVAYDDLDLQEPVRRFVLERDLAAAITIWREGIGQPITPRMLAIRLPEPVVPDRFSAVFGVVPEFNAKRSVMTMDAGLLDLPLPQASELTAKLSVAQCVELLDRRRVRQGVSGRVRAEFLGDLRSIPTQEEIARRLHISVRTLKRQLKREGTNFRSLVSETRESMAEELLRTERLSIDQIADRLGYSEASSFVHAFTRWKGTAPRTWARQHSGIAT